jgi:hypothetical protein
MLFLGGKAGGKPSGTCPGLSIASKGPEPDDATPGLEVVGADSNHTHIIEMVGLESTDNNSRFLVRGDISNCPTVSTTPSLPIVTAAGVVLPTTPLTCIKNFCTGRFGEGRDQLRVAASALIPANETSGRSGTSTPRMLINSGTGVHKVCHALRASLHSITR